MSYYHFLFHICYPHFVFRNSIPQIRIKDPLSMATTTSIPLLELIFISDDTITNSIKEQKELYHQLR